MSQRTNLQKAVDAHLRRVGSSLSEFLRASLDQGDSTDRMADELARITDIRVSGRTCWRWAQDLVTSEEAS